MNSTWSHSCWYPQGNIRKSRNDRHASEGQKYHVILSSSNRVTEFSSGNCAFANQSSGRFHPGFLFVRIYLFIPPFFSAVLGPILQAAAAAVVAFSSAWSACAEWQSDWKLWSQLSSPISALCKAMLADVSVCGEQGMTVCWPGREPGSRPLGKLACTLSGKFCYLPAGQNDFAIDRGFVMSAIPFFENTGKTERVVAERRKFHFFLNWVETSSGKLKKNPRGGEERKK